MSNIGSSYLLEVEKILMGLKFERQLKNRGMQLEQPGWFKVLANLVVHKILQIVSISWIRRHKNPINCFEFQLLLTTLWLSIAASSWCKSLSFLLKDILKIGVQLRCSQCLELGLSQKKFLSQTPANLIGTDLFESIEVYVSKELQKSWVYNHQLIMSNSRVKFNSLFVGRSS